MLVQEEGKMEVEGKNPWQRKIWKAVPFILAPKKVKYLGIHLTKDTEVLCE